MRWSCIVCLFALSVLSPVSARAEPLPVQTVEFDGKNVGRKMKYNIVLPAKYAQSSARYPVLYLLHGYSSNYTAWARMGVPEYARQFDLIVVMPDAGNSWYVNWAQSDEAQVNRWEDFIIKDLIGHVDAAYRTIARREGRAINGLSMGGYGGLMLGLRHPDLFCAIGSHSGAIAFARDYAARLKSGSPPRPRRPPSTTPDPRIGVEGFSSQAERSPKGKIFTNADECAAYDPFHLVLQVPQDKLPHIYLDCGTEDRLLKSAAEFSKLLREHKIPFVYGESGGGHVGAYWRREVAVSMAVQHAVIERNRKAAAERSEALAAYEAVKGFRPPAVPLVACDPYFSIWSPADKLTDAATIHWTGKAQPLTSLVRIDGKTWRIMGPEPKDIPALRQTSVEVLPTRTVYTFDGSGIRLTLTFTTPALPDDLLILSRPVTYLTWEARSTDQAAHEVTVYFDSSTLPAVNTPKQQVVWSREPIDGLVALRAGSKDQPVLQKRGDDLRIDWGYLYVAAAQSQKPAALIAPADITRTAFNSSGQLAGDDAPSQPVPGGQAPVLAMSFDLGKVEAQPVTRCLIYAYDDLYSIQYFKQNLRPYWRKHGWEAADLLKASAREYDGLLERCKALDEDLVADMTRLGGAKYARIVGLAYRQAFAGCKIAADASGAPLVFPKENFSNGCIGTVDVIYPMAPQFLLFGPTLAKAILVQNLDYASSPRWKWPFAPHDLGTYPLANGQVYGGGERTEQNQMPVEETGNMLILLAALARVEGNADFAGKYWPIVQKWADYLKAKGFDPENQLCTDDFAGHLAHNVNLSAKAIVALGAYAQLCQLRGHGKTADEFMELARTLAARWIKEADDGDHYRLAFDRANTWSQKYNLVWDKILGLGLFPDNVLKKEMAFYQKTQQRYGLPLDNRKRYTKIDWTLWTACLTGERDDFDALVAPVYDFLNATPDRSPMTDWFETHNARRVGFTARPVVGGLVLRALYDPAIWKKYAARDRTRMMTWAPLPVAP
ncbi:MAG TPA: DUF4965 domain-containing protein [Gemmataceae bacterium]|nr:DUF4965 domain-containing protein [Gemmataceae bacterium]